MKKIIIAVILSLVMVSLIAVPAVAAPDNAQGSVKVPLIDNPGAQVVIGTVILNTTGSGKLNVLVNLDDTPVMLPWDIGVRIEGFLPPYHVWDVLYTNVQGEDNVQFSIDIPEEALGGEYITVGVDVGFLPPPQPPLPGLPNPIRATTGWVQVPLK
jgi:hypothetical protein